MMVKRGPVSTGPLYFSREIPISSQYQNETIMTNQFLKAEIKSTIPGKDTQESTTLLNISLFERGDETLALEMLIIANSVILNDKNYQLQ
jgi:hypothetical protein